MFRVKSEIDSERIAEAPPEVKLRSDSRGMW